MKRTGWIVGALAVSVALVALGSAFAGAQDDDTRRGTDPLSIDEVQAATDEAAPDDDVRTESLGANGLPEQVVLLVERHEEEKADESGSLRRADVYEYSYPDDALTTSVVDLADGSIDKTTTSQGTQLPLVEVETARAVEILFADPEFADLLATQFQIDTGRPLGDPDADLDLQTIVFLADAMPTVAEGAAGTCGIDRCAQFLMQSSDHLLINLFPLVNLSDGTLITTNGASGS